MQAPVVCSFAPIGNKSARVLVLGSMPGAESLRAGRYYAYKHNAFWPIMGELFDAGPAVAYEKRVLLLQRAGLAVWDVMASCIREGSLDSDIDEASIDALGQWPWPRTTIARLVDQLAAESRASYTVVEVLRSHVPVQ